MIRKKWNKKAMFFTILVLVLLSFFLVSYEIYNVSKDGKNINNRVNTMNNFIFSLEQNIPRKLYISGFRIIFLFEKRIITTGDYIDDVEYRFQEAFFNGTIKETVSEEENQLLEGIIFSDIQGDLNEKARIVNINLTFSNPEVNITQVDSWNIQISLKFNLLIEDNNNLVSWNKTSFKVVSIPINNFEDPLYVVNTNGKITNKIIKSPYEEFVVVEDVSNLINHVENSYYLTSSTGPNFLERLEGKTSPVLNPNPYGIESLVYLPEFINQSIITKDKSVVDYIYFSDNNPTTRNILGMPNWFRLDENHIDVYNVGNILI